MDLTIDSYLSAHRGGREITQTIRQTYARIEAHADPALFISTRSLS